MMSEDYRLRLAIDHILASRRIGFFRLCGRDLQIMFRKENLTKSNKDRAILMEEIIETYNHTLDNMVNMSDKERKFKKRLIRRYAAKSWERRR